MNKVTKLTQLLKPKKIGNIWQSPRISLRVKNDMYKEYLHFGTVRGEVMNLGEEWMKEKKIKITKPPKGHKFDNEIDNRVDEIVKKLDEMPKLIKEYKKEYHEQHKKPTLLEKFGLKDIYTEDNSKSKYSNKKSQKGKKMQKDNKNTKTNKNIKPNKNKKK